MTPEAAVEEFDALVRSAPPVPLTDEVRVNRRRATKLVAVLGGSAAGSTLQQLVEQARKVPLTGQVRLDPDIVFACLDEIRATR